MLYEKWNSFSLACDSFLLLRLHLSHCFCQIESHPNGKRLEMLQKKIFIIFRNVFLTFKSFLSVNFVCIEFFEEASEKQHARHIHSHKFHIFVNFLVSGFKEKYKLLAKMLADQRTCVDQWGDKKNTSKYNIPSSSSSKTIQNFSVE